MFKPNESKVLTITLNQEHYERLPLKTHVVMHNEHLFDIVDTYAKPYLRDADILFITEKIVAITQGRAYPLESIKPRPLATWLSKFVTKTPHGIGLGMPETMEMALQECGTPRIIMAAGVAAITKLFGRKGDFYRVAGEKARAIDGPTSGTIPPYDHYVVLGPENPHDVAMNVKNHLKLNLEVIIVDINDLGGNILGVSNHELDTEKLVRILHDNPLGQEQQATPMGIIRKV